jgi:hypothetical protein
VSLERGSGAKLLSPQYTCANRINRTPGKMGLAPELLFDLGSTTANEVM